MVPSLSLKPAIVDSVDQVKISKRMDGRKKWSVAEAWFVFFRNLQYNLSDESKSWKENHSGGGSLAKPYAQSKYTQWLINQSQQLIRQSKHDWACIGLG